MNNNDWNRNSNLARCDRIAIFLKTFLFVVICCLDIVSADDDVTPNIVLIVTDDQGYADVGFNGCKDIPTPNLDRIAKEGVRFTNGYVSYAVCGPSRAGMMTGRYQGRFGFTTNPTIDPTNPNSGIPLSETTMAEALKACGYRNMIIGKWHLGTHPTLRPLKRGFDEFFGFLSGGHDYFTQRYKLRDLSEVKKQWGWYRTKLLENDKRVDVTGYLTDVLSAKAVDFIERSKDDPFFLYLAYNAPHTPMQATPKYLDRFPDIKDDKRRTYAAMLSAVDDGVGLVLDKLDQRGLTKNTVVVYLSDNGGATNNASKNTPLRGHKGSFFEGGLRVPFAIRFPQKIKPNVDYEPMVSALDLYPTLVTLAGGEMPKKQMDGVDLLPYLTGENPGEPHEFLAWRNHGRELFAIRNGHQKLILNPKGESRQLLFDLSKDLREKSNLARAESEPESKQVVAKLNSEIERFKSELKGPAFPSLGTWLRESRQNKK